LRDFYRKASLWIGARRADRVVTVSDSSKSDIVQFLKMAPEQVAVVHNGVGREFFVHVECEQAQAELAGRYPVDEPYLLYVGALELPNKNLLRMLQAYHHALATFEQPHRLLLAGPKRRAAELVFAEIERLGLSGRVQWLGYVPRVDLPLLYAGAACFVYVSLWEGFGLPVLEAMASGAPVIASNVSSLPEVLGEAGVLVDPANVEAIATAMVQVCNDESLRQRMRRAGRERAGQFSWPRAAAQLLAVFHSVLLNGAPYGSHAG
jgi:glycosyltransferase involved in cell wall biosynthesis